MTPTKTLEEQSLYELLDLAAPLPEGSGNESSGGETAITATKETMDNDTEETSDDDILNL